MTSRLFASLLVAMGVIGLWSSIVYAQNPGRVAKGACSEAVTNEVYGMFPQARRVQFVESKLRQVSNAETGVSGKGQFTSAVGWTRFTYSCIYNIRSGATYAVNIRGGGTETRHGKDSAGKVIGAVIGTAIAAAIVESVNHDQKHHNGGGSRDWFSPSAGVSCSTSQSICYDANGTIAHKWTQRIFIDGEYAN